MLYMPETNKRITVICGHYGSGKTEIAVSLAMLLAEQEDRKYSRLAVLDLDVANPYFRSRERRSILEDAGIQLYGSMYADDLTAELPAITANVRAPLEDKNCRVIVDLGGNDSGALVLNQFGKYFAGDEHELLAVVNANRPETRDLDGAAEHLASIENVLGLKVDGIINNCHLLRETTAATIRKGHNLCMELCKLRDIPLWCDCYPSALVKREELVDLNEYLLPLGLYMRPEWLDK